MVIGPTGPLGEHAQCHAFPLVRQAGLRLGPGHAPTLLQNTMASSAQDPDRRAHHVLHLAIVQVSCCPCLCFFFTV